MHCRMIRKPLSSVTCLFVILLILTKATVEAQGQVGSISSHTMAKSIDVSSGTPLAITVEFLTIDDAAYSWFEIRSETWGWVTFRWKWYEPDGSIIGRDTGDARVEQVEKGKVHRFWDTLPIRGAPPEKKVGKWRVEVFARAEKLFEESFTISPPTYKVSMTVSGFEPKFSTAVYVDGAPKGVVVGGSGVNLDFLIGTSHNVSVDEIVLGEQGIRYHCTAPARAVSATCSHAFAYVVEYQLDVKSQHGTVVGEGWYRSGSAARISVDTPVAGPVGVKYRFKQWSGDSTATSPETTLMMDGPRFVSAVWDTDYGEFALIVAAIAGAATMLTIVPMVTRRKRAAEGTRRKSILARPGVLPRPSGRLCGVCGRPVIRAPGTNKYYCPNCKKYV